MIMVGHLVAAIAARPQLRGMVLVALGGGSAVGRKTSPGSLGYWSEALEKTTDILSVSLTLESVTASRRANGWLHVGSPGK